MPLEIIVDYDSVVIEGVRVPRPPTMSVVEWMEYWENPSKSWEDGYNKCLEELGRGLP